MKDAKVCGVFTKLGKGNIIFGRPIIWDGRQLNVKEFTVWLKNTLAESYQLMGPDSGLWTFVNGQKLTCEPLPNLSPKGMRLNS